MGWLFFPYVFYYVGLVVGSGPNFSPVGVALGIDAYDVAGLILWIAGGSILFAWPASLLLAAKATDVAGNEAAATPLTYKVLAASASGFHQPVDMATKNTVKNGSTVPVKFELFGGASGVEQKELTDVHEVSAKQIACGTTPTASDAIEEIVSTNSSGLRFDTTGDQFIYNWKTPKGSSYVGKCYLLSMTAADQQTKLLAYFELK